MEKRKTTAQIKREIIYSLAGETTLFYPGGDGGGGSRRKRTGTPVVRPHARTYSGCKECSRLHSMAQHASHRGKAISVIKKTKKSTKKAKKKNKISVYKKMKKVTRPKTLTPRDLVRSAVSPGGVPASGRYHGEKVFVAAIYDYVKDAIGMSMDQFKLWLVNQNRLGYLVLARADLVGAMDRTMVTRSEIESYGATFHFVLAS